jgi:hypothetical protein
MLRNALGEGLAAALEIFDDESYKSNKKYCIILSNTAYYNSKIRYSKKYFRKDINSLLEEYKKKSIDITLFTTLNSVEPSNNIIEKICDDKGRVYMGKNYLVRLDELRSPSNLFAEFEFKREKELVDSWSKPKGVAISNISNTNTVVNSRPVTPVAKKIKIEEKIQKPINSLINLDISKEHVEIPLQNEKKNVENIKQLKFIEEQQKKHQNYINKTQTSSAVASPASSVEMNLSSQPTSSMFGVSNIKTNGNATNTVKTDIKSPINKVNNTTNSKNIKVEMTNNSTSSIASTPPKSSVSGTVNITTPTMNSSSVSSTANVNPTVKKQSIPSTPNLPANKTNTTPAVSNKPKVATSTKTSGVTTPVKATPISSNTSSSTKVANVVNTTSNQIAASPAVVNKNMSPTLNANNVAPGLTSSVVNNIPAAAAVAANDPRIAAVLQMQKNKQTVQNLSPQQIQQLQLRQQLLNKQQDSQQQNQAQPQKTPGQQPLTTLQNRVAKPTQVQQQTSTTTTSMGWKGLLCNKEENIKPESGFNLIGKPCNFDDSDRPFKKEDYLFDSWPSKLIIDQLLNGDISKFIEKNKSLMPFVKFEPQEQDKTSYQNLAKNLSEKKMVIYCILCIKI